MSPERNAILLFLFQYQAWTSCLLVFRINASHDHGTTGLHEGVNILQAPLQAQIGFPSKIPMDPEKLKPVGLWVCIYFNACLCFILRRIHASRWVPCSQNKTSPECDSPCLVITNLMGQWVCIYFNARLCFILGRIHACKRVLRSQNKTSPQCDSPCLMITNLMVPINNYIAILALIIMYTAFWNPNIL